MCALEIASNAPLYYEALLYRANEAKRKQEHSTVVSSIQPPHCFRTRCVFGIKPDYLYADGSPSLAYSRSIQIIYGTVSMDSYFCLFETTFFVSRIRGMSVSPELMSEQLNESGDNSIESLLTMTRTVLSL